MPNKEYCLTNGGVVDLLYAALRDIHEGVVDLFLTTKKFCVTQGDIHDLVQPLSDFVSFARSMFSFCVTPSFTLYDILYYRMHAGLQPLK